jgi:ribonuclease P protein component
MGLNSLPKNERLHGTVLINHLFKQGDKLKVNPFRIIWHDRKVQLETPVRFGISVSRRISKLAVKRNYIKRICREAYRISKHDLVAYCEKEETGLDFFLIYLGPIDPDPIEIQSKIILILNRLKDAHGRYCK